MAQSNAWLTLVRMVGQKIVAFLPRLILKRFYPLEALAAHIDIDVRNLEFRLDDVPRAYLWLRITNRSPYVDIQVHHVFVDIWDTQPLGKLSTSERDVIPRCTRPKKAALCDADLTDAQVRRLRQQKETSEEFMCHIRAVFESALGSVEWRDTIRGVRARFVG